MHSQFSAPWYTTFESALSVTSAPATAYGPATRSGGDHDDDQLDTWLATLSVQEFERFLGSLAGLQNHVPSALAPPAWSLGHLRLID